MPGTVPARREGQRGRQGQAVAHLNATTTALHQLTPDFRRPTPVQLAHLRSQMLNASIGCRLSPRN